jgi:integrase
MSSYAVTTRALKFSIVKSWLDVNGITINSGVLRTLNGKKAVEAISEEHIPSGDELERILKHLPLHCSAAALTIVSSGMRPGETFKLTFDNIDMDSYPVKVSFKSSQTKSGKKRWTYLSPQAKQEIEAWLEYRDQFIEKALRYVKADNKETFLKRVDSLVFPFRFQTFQKNWKTAVEKAGLLKIDESTSRLTIRPHNLRKFFSTYGKWPDRDIPQFLMGHVSALRAVYVRYDRVEESVRARCLCSTLLMSTSS